MHVQYLIIGNGVAGINAARTLAEGKPGVEPVVYAAEPYPYYNRWQLPALLAGELQQQDIYLYPESWYSERGIRVKLGQAVGALDPASRKVTLSDSTEIEYDELVLATGASAFVPPISGAAKEGVFRLRTMDDALSLRTFASGGHQAAVIGGGLLGLEAARSLHALGLEVTVIEFFQRLLPRQLDPQGAELFQSMIEEMGIHVRLNAATEEVLGENAMQGLRFKDGSTLRADLAVISAGIRSNLQLAKDAGLQINRGIVVNDQLQTSAPHIYAAGDAAEYKGQIYGIIPAAIEQATAAAKSILGQEAVSYQGTIPSTTLKVVGLDLTSIGAVNPEGEGFSEFRVADRAQRLYRKVVLQNGRIVGAILIGDKGNVAPISRLIRGGNDVSAYTQQFQERDFDFRELLQAPPRPPAATYTCSVCGYVYDPQKGDPEGDIPAGAPFESLPDSWVCPSCGASKEMFNKTES